MRTKSNIALVFGFAALFIAAAVSLAFDRSSEMRNGFGSAEGPAKSPAMRKAPLQAAVAADGQAGQKATPATSAEPQKPDWDKLFFDP